MKAFEIGAKVEVLWSGGDNAPDWTPAVVVNEVKPGDGFERHGQFHGNIVRIESGRYLTVTEPGMIRHA